MRVAMATGLCRVKGPPHFHISHLTHVELGQLCSEPRAPPGAPGSFSFCDIRGSLGAPGRNLSPQATMWCVLWALPVVPPGVVEEETEVHRGPVMYPSPVMTVHALCRVRT